MDLDAQLEAFREILRANDLIPPNIIEYDGKPHRCDVSSDNGKNDGSYLLLSIHGILVGWVHNWQTSERIKVFKPDLTGLPPIDAKAIAEELKRIQEEKREDERKNLLKVKKYYDSCSDFMPKAHEYLLKKGIEATKGVKIGTWGTKFQVKDCLIIPIHDVEGNLVSCQAIQPNGFKCLAEDVPLKSAFHMVGDVRSNATIIVTESYTNAVSINSSTNCATVCTFGKNRFEKVCLELHTRYPKHNLVIAADNDYGKYDHNGELKPNFGLLAAEAVRESIPELQIILPPEDEDLEAVDWNEFACKHGAHALKSFFKGVVIPFKQRLFNSEDLDLIPPEWVIKGLLEQDSVSFLVGPTSTGKSYIALSMACSISTGTDFLGTMQVKQGAVIYIIGEAYRGIIRRKKAWQLVNQVEETPSLIFSKAAFRLSDREELDALKFEINMLSEQLDEPIKLIIIDTLAKNIGDGDENSARDSGLFISHMDELREEYKCCVMVVHHTGHDKTRGRGSSALKAGIDTELCVNRSDKNSQITILTPTKTKDGSAPEPIQLGFDPIILPGLEDNFGDPVVSAVIRLANKDEKENFIGSEIFKGLSYEKLFDSITPNTSMDSLVQMYKNNETEIRAAIFSLTENGYLMAAEGEDEGLITKTGKKMRVNVNVNGSSKKHGV